MPLVYSLLGGLLSLTGSLVGRVMLALGMGLVSFTGFTMLTGAIFDSIKANMGGLPADVLSFLAFMWVDKAIGVIVSAVNVGLTIKLAGSTSLKKWIVTRPTI